MANPNRKMATLRRIDAITPIDGADRIVAAHIGGWTVVVGKGEFKKGEIVIFFEIDSFLPTETTLTGLTPSPFAFLAPRGTKTMVIDGVEYTGHVLRTAKLRGTYSQGLVMKADVFIEAEPADLIRIADEGRDLTEACGVCEYYKPLPPGQVGIIRRYDPFVAPRTDATRAQNVSQEVFDLIKRCDYRVSTKVDGTSITMLWDSRVNGLRLFSHNNEIDMTVGIGKTATDAAKAAGIVDFCENHHDLTVQFELCGPKIQSDRLGLGKHVAFAFSVFDTQNRCYIDCQQAFLSAMAPVNIAPYLDINLDDYATPTDLIEAIDGLKSSVTKNRLDEGIVVHVLGRGDHDESSWNSTVHDTIESELGAQMQMKIISNKYLLKA